MQPRIRYQRRGYTLVEMLVVITILGIAGALLVPSFGQTDALRVQAAVRTLVADVTVAQSDAMAFQRGRGIQFTLDGENSRYVVAAVNGNTLDVENDAITTQAIGGEVFGHARFSDTNMVDRQLIFDELGSPITLADGETASTQWIDIAGRRQTYRMTIEAYTGRCTVALASDLDGIGAAEIDP